MMVTKKRAYEKKLAAQLATQERFFLDRLRKEWDARERSKRREELLNMTKQAGIIVGKTLLVLAAISGAVAITAIAPNVFSAFGRVGKKRRFFAGRELNAQLRYLERRGAIRITRKEEDEITKIRLTEFGTQKVIAHAFGELKITPQEVWDGKWRMVIFDIPNRHKWAREGIREKLKLMGFYPLQKSVFVFPYPCEEEIVFLSNIYHTGPALVFVETESLMPEKNLLKYFGLTRK